jgi:hypothetical protein
VVNGFTIKNGYVDDMTDPPNHGGAIYCHHASPTISNNIIERNDAFMTGGGIFCEAFSAPLIIGNVLRENRAFEYAGAIGCESSSPIISGNIIRENTTNGHREIYGDGAGIFSDDESSPTIVNNLIEENRARGDIHGPWPSGGGVFCRGDGVIAGNTIVGNSAYLSGGGIHTFGSPMIIANRIIENDTGWAGGGLFISNSQSIVRHNTISGNTASSGAGIYVGGSNSDIYLANNLISGNEADFGSGYTGGHGGGIYCRGSMTLENNTIAWNSAPEQGHYDGKGGGLYCSFRSTAVEIVNTIFWGNTAASGAEIYLTRRDYASGLLTIRYSDVMGGQASVYVDPFVTMNWGAGMIDADPLFAAGPLGGYYLGQVGAGQAADSPCVNSGSAPSDDLHLDYLTTRTDGIPDLHTVDMGFHYEIPGTEPDPDTFILTGPREIVNSPTITLTFTGVDDQDPPPALRFSYCLDGQDWTEFTHVTTIVFPDLEPGLHTFQVRAIDRDGNIDPVPASRTFFMEAWAPGDGWQCFVTGPGPGPTNPPLVRTPLNEWLAYGVHRYGVNVACGDLDGLDMDEVLTGPGPGAVFGPNVRGWLADGTPVPDINFLAYGTRKYGVRVAAGNFDDDAYDEFITGPGPGRVFGPHVRGWSYDGSALSTISGINFFAYGTRQWGVNVAAGDIDGDGYDEIITGAGPGAVFGPHVRGWNYDGAGATTGAPGCNFMAYGTPRYGVNAACGELEGDGREEIITGPGPGPGFRAHVRAWDYDGDAISPMPGIHGFAYDARYGLVVGGGDVDRDGLDEILTLPGPGPSLLSHVRAWHADGGTILLETSVNWLAYDRWISYGGTIAGGNIYRSTGRRW